MVRFLKNPTVNKIKNWMLDVLYPNRIKCIFCDCELNELSDKSSCEFCMDKLPFIENPCPKCGNPMNNDEIGVCFECKSKNYEFEQAVSTFEYSGKVLKALHDFKYKGVEQNFEPLGEYMCETFFSWDICPDVITFVPMTAKKLKQRGFNQAELLARFVAKHVNIPCAEIVEKLKDNLVQASLNYEARQQNIKDCFVVKPDYRKLIKGTTILLIDDIFTTGATSNEISKILKHAGAEKIYVLTLAHTNKEKTF